MKSLNLDIEEKNFKLEVKYAIPDNLHLDEELFVSTLINIFCIAMHSMLKGTIYILIKYDYRHKCLKVDIEQKGRISDHNQDLKPDFSHDQSYVEQFSIVNPESLEFNQGGKVPLHYQITLEIISQTLMKNHGYFKLQQSVDFGRTFSFALKALPAKEPTSDHEEPSPKYPRRH